VKWKFPEDFSGSEQGQRHAAGAGEACREAADLGCADSLVGRGLHNCHSNESKRFPGWRHLRGARNVESQVLRKITTEQKLPGLKITKHSLEIKDLNEWKDKTTERLCSMPLRDCPPCHWETVLHAIERLCSMTLRDCAPWHWETVIHAFERLWSMPLRGQSSNLQIECSTYWNPNGISLSLSHSLHECVCVCVCVCMYMCAHIYVQMCVEVGGGETYLR
jgi:hypothetical protein